MSDGGVDSARAPVMTINGNPTIPVAFADAPPEVIFFIFLVCSQFLMWPRIIDPQNQRRHPLPHQLQVPHRVAHIVLREGMMGGAMDIIRLEQRGFYSA